MGPLIGEMAVEGPTQWVYMSLTSAIRRRAWGQGVTATWSTVQKALLVPV